MANYSALKGLINQYITTNGQGDITGAILNQLLKDIVDSLGADYQFVGVATPSTNPGNPDQRVFYLATTAGTYTNFNSQVIGKGLSVLKYDSAWSVDVLFSVDDYPAMNSHNFVESNGLYIELYNKDLTAVVDYLFESTPYSGSVNTRNGYNINPNGSGNPDANYKLYIIKPTSEQLFLVETTYTTSQNTMPTAQLRPNDTLNADDVYNVSFKHGSTSFLIGCGPKDTRKVIVFVCDVNVTPTITELTPKYNSIVAKIEQLIKGVITETVTFPGSSYEYTQDSFYPIPAGAVITSVSGAATSVNGYDAKDANHVTLRAGVTVPYQINVLRAINYSGSVTIEYKTVPLAKIDAEISRSVDKDNSLQLSIDHIMNFMVWSPNLANPTEFVPGKYVQFLNGQLQDNSSYTATGFIPVTAGLSYYMSYKHQIAWYDANKVYVSGSSASDSNKIQVAPANAAFLRCTISNGAVPTFIVAQSSEAVTYEPYGSYLKGESLQPHSVGPDKLTDQIQQDQSYINDIGDVVSGAFIETTIFPYFVKKGLSISFYAKITSFSELYIGKGYQQYRGRYIKITSSSIFVYSYESSETQITSFTHGLTLATFIRVTIVQNDDGTTNIVLQTVAGEYTCTISNVSFEWNNKLFVKSISTVLTDAVVSAVIQDITKPVWLFGDSYFGVSNERVIGQLKNLGLFTYLVDGLAGLGSESAYSDLQRLLSMGSPKYLVWCLGMNDTDANFKSYFDIVKNYCQQQGITMIGCTIPTVPTRAKEVISEYVRNSGIRYIDAYKAVGADNNGNWYSGYLSSDGVHPTVLGAQAIALQWTVDFPELYIYCRNNN